eukprot:GHVQ01014680.1.p1 GENE.GHVQ01014680.1~~GHVQ01014680.1.p1  ORF type:complete len:662 (-),score=46.38 GHVQ01014680.1:649-2634(-)
MQSSCLCIANTSPWECLRTSCTLLHGPLSVAGIACIILSIFEGLSHRLPLAHRIGHVSNELKYSLDVHDSEWFCLRDVLEDDNLAHSHIVPKCTTTNGAQAARLGKVKYLNGMWTTEIEELENFDASFNPFFLFVKASHTMASHQQELPHGSSDINRDHLSQGSQSYGICGVLSYLGLWHCELHVWENVVILFGRSGHFCFPPSSFGGLVTIERIRQALALLDPYNKYYQFQHFIGYPRSNVVPRVVGDTTSKGTNSVEPLGNSMRPIGYCSVKLCPLSSFPHYIVAPAVGDSHHLPSDFDSVFRHYGHFAASPSVSGLEGSATYVNTNLTENNRSHCPFDHDTGSSTRTLLAEGSGVLHRLTSKWSNLCMYDVNGNRRLERPLHTREGNEYGVSGSSCSETPSQSEFSLPDSFTESPICSTHSANTTTITTSIELSFYYPTARTFSEVQTCVVGCCDGCFCATGVEAPKSRVNCRDCDGRATRACAACEWKKPAVGEKGDSGSIPAVFLFIHGGGWITGDTAFYDSIHRKHAQLLEDHDVVVVGIDYRLAPEHKFPTPLEDCVDAINFLYEYQDLFRIDMTRMFVSGDSAGGGLALASVGIALEKDLPWAHSVQLLALVYPVVAPQGSTPSRIRNAGFPPLLHHTLPWLSLQVDTANVVT